MKKVLNCFYEKYNRNIYIQSENAGCALGMVAFVSQEKGKISSRREVCFAANFASIPVYSNT